MDYKHQRFFSPRVETFITNIFNKILNVELYMLHIFIFYNSSTDKSLPAHINDTRVTLLTFLLFAFSVQQHTRRQNMVSGQQRIHIVDDNVFRFFPENLRIQHRDMH